VLLPFLIGIPHIRLMASITYIMVDMMQNDTQISILQVATKTENEIKMA
jgi:hypothetical protein